MDEATSCIARNYERWPRLAGFHSVLPACRANCFRVSLGLLLFGFQVNGLHSTRSGELAGINAWRTIQRSPLLDAIQVLDGKLLHFGQFLPMGEKSMPRPMVHNTVSEVFGDPG